MIPYATADHHICQADADAILRMDFDSPCKMYFLKKTNCPKIAASAEHLLY